MAATLFFLSGKQGAHHYRAGRHSCSRCSWCMTLRGPSQQGVGGGAVTNVDGRAASSVDGLKEQKQGARAEDEGQTGYMLCSLFPPSPALSVGGACYGSALLCAALGQASIVIAMSSHVSVAPTPKSLLVAGSLPVCAVPFGGFKSRLALH